MKKLLFTLIILILTSCAENAEIKESNKKLDEILNKSQLTIDSAINEIDGVMKDLDGKFEKFERDSALKQTEAILKYEKK